METPNLTILLIAIISVTTFPLRAQNADIFLKRGLQAESKHDTEAALEFYKRAIDADHRNTEALWHASRVLSAQAGRSRDKGFQSTQAAEANALASRAIQLDPASTDARLARVIALGIAAASASNPADKLANAKIIHREIQMILSYDSAFAPAYYVLGKWHLELAKLNWAERLACNVLYGGVPKGVSLNEAIRCFDKAIQLEPGFLLFHYGKASALFEAAKYREVVLVLEHALQLAATDPDDITRRQNCVRLLQKSKQRSNRI